jgi:hypothetical protein
VSKHVPFRIVAAVAATLDSQQTEKMRREIQNPELLLTQVRFSTEQSTLWTNSKKNYLAILNSFVKIEYRRKVTKAVQRPP